ncbi:hypothetical protein D3C86_2000200 [compost metagenome]
MITISNSCQSGFPIGINGELFNFHYEPKEEDLDEAAVLPKPPRRAWYAAAFFAFVPDTELGFRLLFE